jgi:hypothetical protein
LLKRITDQINTIKTQRYFAANEIEGKMSFRVAQIFDSISTPNTPDDVFERFAIIIQDDLRKFYDEVADKKEKKTDTKKKRKKKKGT